MRSAIESWIMGIAIAFVIRQVAKFKEKTEWNLVKQDLADRVSALMPGEWFDAELVLVTDALIDACERALGNTKTLEIILALLAQEKYTEASSRLRDYLLKAWKPGNDPAAAKAMSLIELQKPKA